MSVVAEVVGLMPPEKVDAIVRRLRGAGGGSPGQLCDLAGTPIAAAALSRLDAVWRTTAFSPTELAAMLAAGAHIYARTSTLQKTELVWTGPTTPFVSTRRTEQVLLQVINAATATLFITSYVAYDIANIVAALNEASARGVAVSLLIERPKSDGGKISFDAQGKLMEALPEADFFVWGTDATAAMGGSVHAKVAVADEYLCFITSANLTGHAMALNMEAGVLIQGGETPKLTSQHLRALIATKVIVPV